MATREMNQPPQPLLRPANLSDAPAVATIWFEGWCDGHLGHVPEEALASRTLETFQARAPDRMEDCTVAEIGGNVAGFVMVVKDEAEQVYLDRAHRGSGLATVLLTEAEGQIADAGYDRAWLAVVPGNERARAFYERQGWHDEGRFDHEAEGSSGPITIPCHRYAKQLTGV